MSRQNASVRDRRELAHTLRLADRLRDLAARGCEYVSSVNPHSRLRPDDLDDLAYRLDEIARREDFHSREVVQDTNLARRVASRPQGLVCYGAQGKLPL